jgi:HSP20 family molecular chaperone IbpA
MLRRGQVGQLLQELENFVVRPSLTPFPRVTIFQQPKGHKYTLCAEVPGLSLEQIKLKCLGNNTLEISGTKHDWPKQDEKARVLLDEVGIPTSSGGSSTEFYRTFTLPEKLEATAVDAKLVNGILTVEIPAAKHEEQVSQSEINIKKE